MREPRLRGDEFFCFGFRKVDAVGNDGLFVQ